MKEPALAPFNLANPYISLRIDAVHLFVRLSVCRRNPYTKTKHANLELLSLLKIYIESPTCMGFSKNPLLDL